MSHHDWHTDKSPLVLDASVIINLAASNIGGLVSRLLGRPVYVVDHVEYELTAPGATKAIGGEQLISWKKDGTIIRVELSEQALGSFQNLVSGPASESLDDGEAATIAYAQDINAIVVVDESKGTRICKEIFPDLLCISTIDLLLHPAIEQELGKDGSIEAIYLALTKARMRVPAHHQGLVADLIGSERLAECKSLPARFRCR